MRPGHNAQVVHRQSHAEKRQISPKVQSWQHYVSDFLSSSVDLAWQLEAIAVAENRRLPEQGESTNTKYAKRHCSGFASVKVPN